MARLQQSLRQRSSASDSNLRCRKGEWFRLQQSSRQRSSASDSNFCCRKGEWPACSSRCGSNLPRPILISVATKENGPPAAVVAATTFRVRFYSSLPQKRMARLQQSSRQRPSAYDSNFRCREEERFRLQTATSQRLHRFLNSSSDMEITAGFCQETPSSVQ